MEIVLQKLLGHPVCTTRVLVWIFCLLLFFKCALLSFICMNGTLKMGGTREKRWLPFLTSIFIVVSPQCLCSEDSMRIPVFVVHTYTKRETTYKICKFKVKERKLKSEETNNIDWFYPVFFQVCFTKTQAYFSMVHGECTVLQNISKKSHFSSSKKSQKIVSQKLLS